MFGWFKKQKQKQEINSPTSEEHIEEHIEEMEKVRKEWDVRIREVEWGLDQKTKELPLCTDQVKCPKCESDGYCKTYARKITGIEIMNDDRGLPNVTIRMPRHEHVLCSCNCGYEWQTRPADFDERYKKENGE